MERFKVVLGWLCIVLFCVITVVLVIQRFSFPELTQTQLFLKSWYLLLALAACVGGYGWTAKNN